MTAFRIPALVFVLVLCDANTSRRREHTRGCRKQNTAIGDLHTDDRENTRDNQQRSEQDAENTAFIGCMYLLQTYTYILHENAYCI